MLAPLPGVSTDVSEDRARCLPLSPSLPLLPPASPLPRSAAVAAPTATGIAGGIRLSGGFPPDAVRLQIFEAASSSLATAAKLPAEPTSLFWDRTGLSTGDTRWYWLRAVSAEGNVSALVGPVTATAL